MRKSDLSMAFLLAAFAFLLRWTLITETQFDGLYGQDSYAYFDAADRLAQGNSLGTFFWPAGYPLVLGVGLRLSTPEAATGQLMNVLAGSMLAGLVYVVARVMDFMPIGSLVSGLVIAVCGQAIQSSIVLMSDVPALFFATLSALFLVIYPKRLRGHWLILAGLMLGAAGITRWLYCCLALAWGIFVLLATHRHPHWRHRLAAFGAGLILVVPQTLYSSTTPFPVLNHAWVTGWSLENIMSQTFHNVDGHLHYPVPNLIFYTRPLVDEIYLSAVFIPLMISGVFGLLWKRAFADVALLLTWLVIPSVFLLGIPYQNIRFSLIIIPSAALLTGAGVHTLAKLFHVKIKLRRIRAVFIAALIIICGVGAFQMATAANRYTRHFIEQQQKDKEVVAWAARYIPEGSTVYSFGLTLALRHYTQLTVYELYNESPASLSETAAEHGQAFVLVNTWNLEHQWQGREPHLAFEWLRNERGLARLARIHNFVLYRTLDTAD